MKKRCLIVLMVICVVSIVACGNDKQDKQEKHTESQVESHIKTETDPDTTADNIIPRGVSYSIKLSYTDRKELLMEGQEFPKTPGRGDEYYDSISGYIYTYQQQIGENEYTSGWNVVCKRRDQYTNDYSGTILESICGQPVTSMVGCFEGRRAKMDPIVIPEHITDIRNMYKDCVRLTTAPQIPASVVKMDYAFAGCKRLTGEVVIDANPSTYEGCFKGVDIKTQNIEFKGKSACMEPIKATAEMVN